LWPASRRTVWWRAAWRPAGRPSWSSWPTEQTLTQTTAQRAPLPDRAELQALTSSLPRLWHAPTTQAKDRKRMLRTLIADITVLPEPDRAKLRVGIRWHSGATQELLTSRRPSAVETRRTPDGAVELLRRLGPAHGDAELADELNAAGYLTGAGRPFDPKAVRWLRHVHKVPAPAPFQAGELSVAEVAQRLGITAGAVYHWIQHGQLTARRTPAGRWCVPFGPQVEAACRQKVADSAHLTPQPKPLLQEVQFEATVATPSTRTPDRCLSVSAPRAPGAGSNSPRTSCSRPCTGCPSGPSRTPRSSTRPHPAPLDWP